MAGCKVLDTFKRNLIISFKFLTLKNLNFNYLKFLVIYLA